MGCYQSNTSKEIGISSTWAEFQDDWFAQGPSRLAYRGTLHGDSRIEGKRCVVKVYKQEWYDYEDRGEFAWKTDNRAYVKAHEMSQSFNKEYQTSKHIEFVKPEFSRVNTRAAFKFLWRFPFEREVKGIQDGTRDKVSNVIPENATLAVERYLEGNFIKFSSNTGYVTPEKSASPSAYSHYTYHASDGKILVCDLQGIRGDTGHIFTSPAVHSSGTDLGVYGPTDLGKVGIVKFFKNHTCNVLCSGLNKPKLIADPFNEERLNTIVNALPDDYCSSTYTHELSELTNVPLDEIKRVQSKLKLTGVTE
ncbi:uncharacterized protein LOC119733038 [Patiria miniata]|uniref:Alpha-type protein kinase domain-containing protein n=1 Tax=Patiria miniata TaxID=46514 RepID=A0A914AFN3_PATMI|nr:uncharacterized protein LOC119733038 [Patiria miniata]